MKINKILVLSVSALAVCGTLSAQDLRGVVRDAENQPLLADTIYWEGTSGWLSPPTPRELFCSTA